MLGQEGQKRLRKPFLHACCSVLCGSLTSRSKPYKSCDLFPLRSTFSCPMKTFAAGSADVSFLGKHGREQKEHTWVSGLHPGFVHIASYMERELMRLFH